MSALGQKLVTMADVAKSKDARIGKVAEVLVKRNPILNDIPYTQMNMGTFHKENIRSGLPDVYYRKANEAIPASKSTIEERTFQAAHFESKSQMDAAVAERGGKDRVAFNRWNQATGHIQAMSQEHANLLIYGSPTSSDRKVAGLADIFSTLATTEETYKQIVDAGGVTGDNFSMWLIHWGMQSVFGIYPEGTQAGLKRTDRSSKQLVQIQALDSAGDAGSFYGYEEQFEIDHGLVVKDFRQISRIANIDPALLKSGAGAADLIDLMISADYLIDSDENGQGMWYCNRTAAAFLHKQSLSSVKAGSGLTFENYQGKMMTHFLGKPIRRTDSLLNTEDQITT